MKIDNIRYTFDVSNGWFTIKLNDNKVLKYRYFNDDNVIIGIDENDNIVCIRIIGFRDYAENLINTYLKEVTAKFMR